MARQTWCLCWVFLGGYLVAHSPALLGHQPLKAIFGHQRGACIDECPADLPPLKDRRGNLSAKSPFLRSPPAPSEITAPHASPSASNPRSRGELLGTEPLLPRPGVQLGAGRSSPAAGRSVCRCPSPFREQPFPMAELLQLGQSLRGSAVPRHPGLGPSL